MATVIAMHDRIWYLKTCGILKELDEEQLTSLERCSQTKRFHRGDTIYLPGQTAESVLLVAEGLVKICHILHEGRLSTLGFIEAGEMFGELSLVGDDERREYAEAVEDSLLVRISRESLRELMEKNAGFAMRLTKLVGLRRQRIENRLSKLLFLSNDERLIHLLLDLAEQFGIRQREGILIGLRLSHQELANLIGSSREAVTIAMGKLKARRIVTGKRQRVILSDVGQLAMSVGRSLNMPTAPGMYTHR